MAHLLPTNLVATALDHDELRTPGSVPEASGSLNTAQELTSTSPEGTSPSLNVIHNTNYFGPVMNKINSAGNVSMGPNHGTINQDSGASVLEEESYLAALDFLSKHMASGAIHDSKERCDAPKCMPDTRVAVQDEILSWITDGYKDTDPKRILWVTGPAGTGKTAILGTIAERCKADGMLAATFFFSSFSGSLARRSKTHFVSTLAYQLLQHQGLSQVGQFRTHMSQAIRRDPAILQKRLQTQLEELILLPFRHGASIGASPMSHLRMVIIIDGLDECNYVEDESESLSSGGNRTHRTKGDEQREILSAILHAANDQSFPFIVIIASRPELPIREFFSTGLARDATRELFLDNKYNPDADIRLFYEAKFSSICRRFNLSPQWPSLQVLLQLIADASGQFIYAATVMRFIEGPPPGTQNVAPAIPGLRTPHQRLVRILELRTRAHTSNVRPLEALDILYDSVMRTCSEPLLSMKWLRAIRLYGNTTRGLRTSSVRMPARLVRLWLEQSPGEEVCALGPLSSLICIPSDDCDKRYTFYHKSFVDFFEDESRCADLYVSPIQTSDFILHMYFRNMDNRRFFHLDIRSCTIDSNKDEVFDRIPKTTLYFVLVSDSDEHRMLIFSSADVFKAAEGCMLSCNARKWAEYSTVPETGVPVNDDRLDSRYLISRMFHAVHVWVSPSLQALEGSHHGCDEEKGLDCSKSAGPVSRQPGSPLHIYGVGSFIPPTSPVDELPMSRIEDEGQSISNDEKKDDSTPRPSTSPTPTAFPPLTPAPAPLFLCPKRGRQLQLPIHIPPNLRSRSQAALKRRHRIDDRHTVVESAP
ncbi:hypothetical protein D9611_002102 [Ephemerocybe angulata]|uniref:Nephrocystin 3-like N-terminal domain-containing protein n=1 Tax=Ephemerocybe angulata TaxID=980116 RepID=A0A8H5CIU5_9AGAR|nr:hypothetical protein D9611_002102 [Tulosesus angulatus]